MASAQASSRKLAKRGAPGASCSGVRIQTSFPNVPSSNPAVTLTTVSTKVLTCPAPSPTPLGCQTDLKSTSLNQMKFSQLNDELKIWENELLESERTFNDMVTNINAADRMIFQNIHRLECLDKTVKSLSNTQSDVALELSKRFSELDDIEAYVKTMEKPVNTEMHCVPRAHDPSESVRENLFNSILIMNSNINYSIHQLAQVIKVSNLPESATRGSRSLDPVSQIGCILNYHYECLADIEDAFIKSKMALENLKKLQSQNPASISENCKN